MVVNRLLLGFIGLILLFSGCSSEDSKSDSQSDSGSDNSSSYDGGGESTLDGIDTRDKGFSTLAEPTVVSTFDTLDWGAGQLDESVKVEGSASLRWEHRLDGDGCFEYGGSTFCYLRLEPEAPLDFSDQEFINLWIHNDTRSAYNESYHETYEEVVLDFIYLNLIYEGGSYDALVRLEHEGWRQFSLEKGLFGGAENTQGWGAITDIHFFVSNAHRPITERVVHLDNMTASTLPPGNVPARFLATFENGSFDPDIGSRLVLGQHVYDVDNNISQYHLEYTQVVDNPFPSERNPSGKVFHSHVPQEGYIRAEYEATHVATEGKTHIYAWKEYLPSSTFEGIDYHFFALGQWKTYPCEEAGIWGEQICGGGGIFNDRGLVYGDPSQISMRFRAEPSCFEPEHAYPTDEWTAYALEIYWTRSDEGYYRFYQNGELIAQEEGIKTLFDTFEPGRCDMKWALGVYARWWSTGAQAIDYYLDDMAIFDKDHGVTIAEVLAWQG